MGMTHSGAMKMVQYFKLRQKLNYCGSVYVKDIVWWLYIHTHVCMHICLRRSIRQLDFKYAMPLKIYD